MKARMNLAVAGGLLLLSVCASVSAATPYTVQPGTVAISVGTETFSVTTDQTIIVEVAFSSPELVEGSVTVSNGQVANVTILWRKTGLTIFQGRVVQTAQFRFDVPKHYQAQQDSGHTER